MLTNSFALCYRISTLKKGLTMPPQQLPPNLLTLEQLDLEYLIVLGEIETLLKECQDIESEPPSKLTIIFWIFAFVYWGWHGLGAWGF